MVEEEKGEVGPAMRLTHLAAALAGSWPLPLFPFPTLRIAIGHHKHLVSLQRTES